MNRTTSRRTSRHLARPTTSGPVHTTSRPSTASSDASMDVSLGHKRPTILLLRVRTRTHDSRFLWSDNGYGHGIRYGPACRRGPPFSLLPSLFSPLRAGRSSGVMSLRDSPYIPLSYTNALATSSVVGLVHGVVVSPRCCYITSRCFCWALLWEMGGAAGPCSLLFIFNRRMHHIHLY